MFCWCEWGISYILTDINLQGQSFTFQDEKISKKSLINFRLNVWSDCLVKTRKRCYQSLYITTTKTARDDSLCDNFSHIKQPPPFATLQQSLHYTWWRGTNLLGTQTPFVTNALPSTAEIFHKMVCKQNTLIK